MPLTSGDVAWLGLLWASAARRRSVRSRSRSGRIIRLRRATAEGYLAARSPTWGGLHGEEDRCRGRGGAGHDGIGVHGRCGAVHTGRRLGPLRGLLRRRRGSGAVVGLPVGHARDRRRRGEPGAGHRRRGRRRRDRRRRGLHPPRPRRRHRRRAVVLVHLQRPRRPPIPPRSPTATARTRRRSRTSRATAPTWPRPSPAGSTASASPAWRRTPPSSALKACTIAGYCFADSVAAALRYAGDQQIDVVNLSLFADPYLFYCQQRRRAAQHPEDAVRARRATPSSVASSSWRRPATRSRTSATRRPTPSAPIGRRTPTSSREVGNQCSVAPVRAARRRHGGRHRRRRRWPATPTPGTRSTSPHPAVTPPRRRA